MTQIQLYDATLRDGMGGGGLSLTADEKLRVVHQLDALGVDLIEAGFPSSNPKEQELFALLAGERLKHAEIVAFGMTRRREVSADADEGLRVVVESFAPVCTLVGKSSVRARREGRARLARGEPGDDRRVDRLPGGRGQAGDPRRRALLRRLAGRPRLRDRVGARGRRGRRRAGRPVRHQRRLAAPPDRRGDRGRARRAARRRAGHPLPQRHRLRGGQHAGRRGRRARRRCRARSTGSASARATPTCCRSSPTCSSSWAAGS